MIDFSSKICKTFNILKQIQNLTQRKCFTFQKHFLLFVWEKETKIYVKIFLNLGYCLRDEHKMTITQEELIASSAYYDNVEYTLGEVIFIITLMSNQIMF